MQSREKILAAVLGVVLLGVGGLYLVRSMIFAPIDARIASKNAAASKIEREESEELKIIKAKGQLNTWKSRSLPPDAVAAQRMYIAWLTDLAQSSGFKSPKLTPDRRVSPNKIYVSVRVTIDASASFQEICTFVYRFRRTNLLHRIADLNIEGADGSATAPLKFTLVAEGISLKDAEPRNTLFPLTEITAAVDPSASKLAVAKAEGFPPKGEFLARIGTEIVNVQKVEEGTWTVVRGADGTNASAHAQGDAVELFPIHPSMKERKLEDFRALISQNPFAKPEKPKPPETKPPEKPVVNLEDPAAKSTKLIATTALGNDRQVAFYEQPSDKRTIVKEGSSFSVAGINGTLSSVDSNFILVRIKEETWRLELGKEIAAMQKIDGGPAKGAAADTKTRQPIVALRPGEEAPEVMPASPTAPTSPATTGSAAPPSKPVEPAKSGAPASTEANTPTPVVVPTTNTLEFSIPGADGFDLEEMELPPAASP
ncbi:MAG: hypothetical protein AB7O26_10625 [Planctomycetaceae bacterium]